MPFQQAGAAEVLRAAQKDESFLNHLKSCLSDIVQRSFGEVWNVSVVDFMNVYYRTIAHIE